MKANANGTIDDYGGAGVFFAEHWANLMECAIANGETIEQCADRCSHRASEDMGKWRPTGFLYDCAVSILSQNWVHSEELRYWHNFKHYWPLKMEMDRDPC